MEEPAGVKKGDSPLLSALIPARNPRPPAFPNSSPAASDREEKAERGRRHPRRLEDAVPGDFHRQAVGSDQTLGLGVISRQWARIRLELQTHRGNLRFQI